MVTVIQHHAFNGLSNLKTLNLVANPNLHSLESFAFYGLSSILELSIDDASCKHLPANCFMGVNKTIFHTLTFRRNKIERLDAEAFAGLESLNYISLRSNFLNAIPSKQIENMTELVSIDFSFNLITLINKDSFRNQHMVRFIDLRYNYIKSIEPDSFWHLTQLKYISFNKFFLSDQISITNLDQIDGFIDSLSGFFSMKRCYLMKTLIETEFYWSINLVESLTEWSNGTIRVRNDFSIFKYSSTNKKIECIFVIKLLRKYHFIRYKFESESYLKYFLENCYDIELSKYDFN